MLHIVAVSIYYCSLAYMIVAMIIYAILIWLVLTDGKRYFCNIIDKKPTGRKYRVAMVFLAPLIFALGWGFLLPFANNRHKDAG